MLFQEIGMPSFKIARKTFSTTARRLGVDEGYTRTMLGQKDKSVSISYVDYDDPKLFAKLCLEHIKVLRAFDTIRIYNRWVRKIDEVFGSRLVKTVQLIPKQNPEHVYSAFVIALQNIIDSEVLFLSKLPIKKELASQVSFCASSSLLPL